jgi:hypothetical protein
MVAQEKGAAMTYRDIEAYSRRDEESIPAYAIVGALILLLVILALPMIFPDVLATLLLAGACAIPVLMVLSVFSA